MWVLLIEVSTGDWKGIFLIVTDHQLDSPVGRGNSFWQDTKYPMPLYACMFQLVSVNETRLQFCACKVKRSRLNGLRRYTHRIRKSLVVLQLVCVLWQIVLRYRFIAQSVWFWMLLCPSVACHFPQKAQNNGNPPFLLLCLTITSFFTPFRDHFNYCYHRHNLFSMKPPWDKTFTYVRGYTKWGLAPGCGLASSFKAVN